MVTERLIHSQILWVWIILSCFICSLCFIFPDLDIKISKIFYTPELGFLYSQNFIVIFIFKSVRFLIYTPAIIYISLGLFQYFISKTINKKLLYLTLTLIIGPGLIVNTLFKDNFGRARPSHISEFGGQAIFSKVIVISDQCDKNCSFSSGHAAAIFAFSNISFVVAKRHRLKALNFTAILGFIVGLVRIIQGGHFISDVCFSCFIIFLTNYFLSKIILAKQLTQEQYQTT